MITRMSIVCDISNFISDYALKQGLIPELIALSDVDFEILTGYPMHSKQLILPSFIFAYTNAWSLPAAEPFLCTTVAALSPGSQVNLCRQDRDPVSYYLIDPATKTGNSFPPKTTWTVTVCQCGSDKVGSPNHSSWCDKYD